MSFIIYIQKRIYVILIAVITISFFTSCGIYQPSDARKVSPNADERVRKNLEEGRGITLMGGLQGGKKTSYQFASSNPMWRATLEILISSIYPGNQPAAPVLSHLPILTPVATLFSCADIVAVCSEVPSI